MKKNIYTDFAKLKKDMKDMTFPEKVDHIFTYYKEVFWVGGVALLFIIAVISSAINGTTTNIKFQGIISNMTITDEGYQYITKDFKTYMGFAKGEKVGLSEHEYKPGLTQGEVETAYALLMGVVAQVEAKNLDYMFLTEVSLEQFVPQDFYMDLRKVFTEAELTAFGADLRYGQRKGEGEMFPLTLRVTDMPFVKANLNSKKEDVWLVFIGNTADVELCRTFWEYLNAWAPAVPNP